MTGTSVFRAFIRSVFILLIAALVSQARAALKVPNLTGVWSAPSWGGSEFRLTQKGERVWGKFKYANGEGFARGSWVEGRLILVLTPTTANIGAPCDPRKILVIRPKQKVATIEFYALDLAGQQSSTARMLRKSLHPALTAIEYPYEAELKNCGALPAYDLTFPTASDQLREADSPILAIMADMLKKQPTLALEVAVHVYSMEKEDANQALSEKRADALRKILVEHYGADPSRLTATGYGQEQPLAENTTEDSRAINTRIEFVQLR